MLHNGSLSVVETRAIVHNTIAEASWWNDAIAERILQLLQTALAANASMGPAMKAAFDKALQCAKDIGKLTEDFANEHPFLVSIVCAVVAIGILYLLAPWIIEALGFTEFGPAAGSFASRWQSLYGARVPLGSIFSYLQRLGMTWNGVPME
ncbi:uncharacterized protein MYCGRDRAFT_51611 [Zymoseptoria tritici IPO323]|uniref:Uncharacterized protein n=3 Tax=Zymoseptoria tritici TaxID=1047171 RepID=F9XQS9_ZYMTI|nr:uncharacterized protein MYCGRDRAFT_51611 [Zymoseptoria tritici IPO323]EGP82410.1 hypothetical protein MYCGRDRAFT_51611 [Zymoseptoria tritici IPO323]